MSGLSASSASVPKELKSEITPAVASGVSIVWSVQVSVWATATVAKIAVALADVIAATGIELLILDRKPWRLELYRLADGALDPAGTASVKKPAELASAVLPLSFTLQDAKPRPKLRVRGSKTAPAGDEYLMYNI